MFFLCLLNNFSSQFILLIRSLTRPFGPIHQSHVNWIMLTSDRQNRIELAHSLFIFFKTDGIDNRPSGIKLDSHLQRFNRKRIYAHRPLEVTGRFINHQRQNLFCFNNIAIHTNINDFNAKVFDLLFNNFLQNCHFDFIVTLHRFAYFFTTTHVQPLADAHQSLRTVDWYRLLRTRNKNPLLYCFPGRFHSF